MRNFATCLVGYYGMKNSGDDALLRASLWGIDHYLNHRRVTLTTPTKINMNGYGPFEPTLKKSQSFRGQNRFYKYLQAIKSDSIIFGGGSVFHTAQDIAIKRHMMKLAAGNRSMALGVGLGPFRNAAAERQCRKFLKECSFIGLRDRESYELAEQLAPDANIKLTFDLAPLLLCDDSVSLQKVPAHGIAVCLCPKERFSGKGELERKRLGLLAQALREVYAATGEAIHLINFNGHETLGDDAVHRELQHLLGPKVPTQIIEYDPNPVRVLQRLAQYKAVVSMRLHGAILSYLADTPAIAINYHSKCNGWCDQIGMPDEQRFDASRLDPVALANTLIAGMESGFSAPKLAVDTAIKFAKKNWRH